LDAGDEVAPEEGAVVGESELEQSADPEPDGE
jgi:DNA gyrase subunit A